MTDETGLDDAQDQSLADVSSPLDESASLEEADAPVREPFVRERPARRSVEPINDLETEGEEPTEFVHDSNLVTGGGLSGRAYRRSRAEGKQLRRDLHYGQYLEIPKGRRDIFASRERKTRLKTALALVAVLAALAVVAFFVWEYMQANWGATY